MGFGSVSVYQLKRKKERRAQDGATWVCGREQKMQKQEQPRVLRLRSGNHCMWIGVCASPPSRQKQVAKMGHGGSCGVGFVLSHPRDRNKSRRWGTEVPAVMKRKPDQ